jgi:murein DD-endopeptidase MepM/ murein hydrolase activator NlpD
MPSAGYADYSRGIKKVVDSLPAPGVYIVPDTHKTAFPMAYLYDNIWSTSDPSPYPLSLIEEDSIINIRLINDSSDFAMPGEGRLTSPYGWRDGRFHHGFDVSINHGLPIYAAFSGVVRFARNIYPYGRLVIVRHDNGLETYYAHLSRITVKSGQRINAGEEVGKCGNTGRSQGTHLHFEIRFKGVSINPAHLISLKENRLIHSDIVLRRVNDRYFLYTNGAILHKVRNGDYLHKIAMEYGTTVRKIKETNDINKNGYLKVGQMICIYP